MIVALDSREVVQVVAADLQGGRAVFCPNPKMQLWSNHPRVFLDVGTTGQAQCPYCGTRYQLAAGAARSGGH
jgi:uncharacterized Zn-finger protein